MTYFTHTNYFMIILYFFKSSVAYTLQTFIQTNSSVDYTLLYLNTDSGFIILVLKLTLQFLVQTNVRTYTYVFFLLLFYFILSA